MRPICVTKPAAPRVTRTLGRGLARELRRHRRQSVVLAERPAIFDRYVLAFDEPACAQAAAERCHQMRSIIGGSGAEKPDHRRRRLLRAPRAATLPRRRAA